MDIQEDIVTQVDLGSIWNVRQTKKLIVPIRRKVITALKNGATIEGGPFRAWLKSSKPHPNFSRPSFLSIMAETEVNKLADLLPKKKCDDSLMIEIRVGLPQGTEIGRPSDW